MLFNRFKDLCDEKNISVYRACTDIGLNRSAVAKWKAGGRPNGTTAAKLADYFGVTTDYLLGVSGDKLMDITGLTESQADALHRMVAELRTANRSGSNS